MSSQVKPEAAIADLLKANADYRAFFKVCCEVGALRLRRQAWQFRDELFKRGAPMHRDAVEDGLLTLARRVLPSSPAASWDEAWADELFKDALARMQEHYAALSADEADALDLAAQEPFADAMNSAAADNDPVAYRAACKGWERAGLEALEVARRGVA